MKEINQLVNAETLPIEILSFLPYLYYKADVSRFKTIMNLNKALKKLQKNINFHYYYYWFMMNTLKPENNRYYIDLLQEMINKKIFYFIDINQLIRLRKIIELFDFDSSKMIKKLVISNINQSIKSTLKNNISE